VGTLVNHLEFLKMIFDLKPLGRFENVATSYFYEFKTWITPTINNA